MKVDINDSLKKVIALHTKMVNKRVAEQAAFRCAVLYKEQLISNILTNRYHFTLSIRQIQKRLKLGFNPYPPLFMSGAYVGAIIIKDGNKVTVRSGRHPCKLSFAELSDILEYGRLDKKIPARPVWSLTLKGMKTVFKQVYREEIQGLLKKVRAKND